MVDDDVGDEYFIRVRGRVLGPYSVEQLRSLRNRGQFGRANEVSVDRTIWKPATEIEHLLLGKTSSKRGVISADDASVAVNEADNQPNQPPSRIGTSSWHYAIGDEQFGPVSLVELRGLIANRQLLPDDLVWKSGMSDWTSVRSVPELSGTSQPDSARSAAGVPASFSAQHFCFACGSPTDARAEICPKCGVRQRHHHQAGSSSRKDRVTACLFAFFLGGIGVHHFYLGNTFRGVLYVLFCWTFIPAIISLIDFVVLLCMSDATFQRSYGGR